LFVNQSMQVTRKMLGLPGGGEGGGTGFAAPAVPMSEKLATSMTLAVMMPTAIFRLNFTAAPPLGMESMDFAFPN
jgi:hypothetical protein